MAAERWPYRLALPFANAPHGRAKASLGLLLSALRLPSITIPKRKPPMEGGFLFGAGDGSLRASFGLLALWAAQSLACAPHGRAKASLGLLLSALRLPSITIPKRKGPLRNSKEELSGSFSRAARKGKGIVFGQERIVPPTPKIG